ncbi:hypothetical protein RHSIM_Rhsim11G0146100 [Rhododendron simsii]|uniref:Uncharacterized protein n=1 Tax=Rhododendron simsii TaxID=118357 RepID=A0A834G677_RHOSS|nr:hypothetical protein RHSIM_Rhsim11G0146100 [Rhododendron simsii]
MELVTGKKPVEPEFGENNDIVQWVTSDMRSRGSVLHSVDSTISEAKREDAARVLTIAMHCTMKIPALRPSMRMVVQMLEEAEPCELTGIIVNKGGENGRVALKKALSPLLKVSPASCTAICKPGGISLQAFPVEQNDVFPLLSVVLRIHPAFVDHFCCTQSITADFDLDFLDFILSFAPDEGNINIVAADYVDEEVNFASGASGGDFFRTLYLSNVRNEHFLEIDDSVFEYAVVVGIASEDFRRIIWHFRDLSPFVEAIVTDEDVTFIFGPEEIVLRTEDGNCVIGGINGYNRVTIRLSLLNPDSLLEASELSASVWMLKSRDRPDMLSCPVQQIGNVVFYFKNEHTL